MVLENRLLSHSKESIDFFNAKIETYTSLGKKEENKDDFTKVIFERQKYGTLSSECKSEHALTSFTHQIDSVILYFPYQLQFPYFC